MTFNIDIAIFIGFLIINLIVGLIYSGGIKNISQYATGGQKFSTGAIVATIVATFIGGGSFSMWTSGVYTTGLYHMLFGIGDVLGFYIICYIIAPRCGEFLGTTSVASAMGRLYNSSVIRIITASTALFKVAGTIAMQFKVAAIILGYAFGDFGNELMIFGALIVITYSALGGIRAVIMTDIIQLLTFAVFIPILAFIIWNHLDNPAEVVTTISSNSIFDYRVVFSFNGWQELIGFIFIIIAYVLSALDPAMFQRIAIANNVKQIKKTFFWAAFCILLITLLTYWIAILLLTEPTKLDPDKIIPHLLDSYPYVGLRGLILAGIMAMLISTADSYLNTAAVLFAHDLVKPMGLVHSEKTELLISRLASVFVGGIAVVLAISVKDMLEIILFTANFYLPIVALPLGLAIFGFRSSSKAVLAGMLSGFFTTTIFLSFQIKLDPTIPAMLVNAAILFSVHYLLKEPGGWVGIKDQVSLNELRQERRERNHKLIECIRNFNLMTFFKNNTPKHESIYFSFGLFAMVSMFCVMHSIPKSIHEQYALLRVFIFDSVLFLAAIFLSYPAWPERFKSKNMIAIIWNIGSVYVMVFASSLLVIMSNFGQLPMMISMINLIVIAALMRWQTALLMLVIGVYSAITFFKWQMGVDILPNSNIELQFKFIYALLLITSSLIMFFKPKQERQELTEEKVDHLGHRIADQEKEIEKALMLKAEFLRNLTHEFHASQTGITSVADILVTSYDKLTDKQLKTGLATILKSSQRLDSYSDNIINLAKLCASSHDLKITRVDLSTLVYDHVELCKKLYIEDRYARTFVINIENNIVANCDEYYIGQTIDNLIINAINYCQKGQITIELKKTIEEIEFSITDEGIGIPQEEIYDIFDPFTVSSKTKTSAGGRGIGLALCKKVIELHGGVIKAGSDSKRGATFKFTLPL